MSMVSQLIAAQEQLRGLIERSVTNFNKLAKEKQTAAAARSRSSTLRDYWEKFMNNNMQLEAALDDDAPERDSAYFKNEVFSTVSEFFDSGLDFYQELINKSDKFGAPFPEFSQAHSMEGDVRTSCLKLSSISLPKFSGDLKTWENFRDLFLSLVDSNASLTDVQRLHYLKTSLTGEAALVLKHTTITDANYQPAWQLLNSRYNDIKLIVNDYLKAFVDIPPVRSAHVLADLKLLRDQSNDIRSALLNLKRPVNQSDDLFNFIFISKFDQTTRLEWEQHAGHNKELPTFEEIDSFLSVRIRVLSAMESPSNLPSCTSVNKLKHSYTVKSAKVHQLTTEIRECVRCGGKHPLFRCFVFKKDSVEERRALATKASICFNCLKGGHMAPQCDSANVCTMCKRKHHTLLHSGKFSASTLINPKPDEVKTDLQEQRSVNHSVTNYAIYSSILPTARVTLYGGNGRSLVVRALLDQGSQVTCITQKVARLLKLKQRHISLSLKGIGSAEDEQVQASVSLTISPHDAPQPCFDLHAVVLPKLTAYTSPEMSPTVHWPHLEGLPLADPYPHSKTPIDLLVGASDFGLFILPGLSKGPCEAPIAQQTVFGWVISGSFNRVLTSNNPLTVNQISALPSLSELMTKFWELEELPQQKALSEEERECEEHFRTTHRRMPDGRYMVSLPFKNRCPPVIGDTFGIAEKQAHRTERRLQRDPDLQKEYSNFMREYEELGHMERVLQCTKKPPAVFIPHLPVVRTESKTTKVRVVFNASCKSTNQKSLNDFLHIGPKLQTDPFALISMWRTFKFVCVADLAKMFRQIWIQPADTVYQQILWRDSPTEKLSIYRMLTVTYGTACAPYLANRVLHQLAEDEGPRFPLAQPLIKSSFYVDDVLFGDHHTNLLREKRDQLNQLLAAGGFTLRKWASNAEELLQDIPRENHGLALDQAAGIDEKVKILGITWYPKRDILSYNYAPPTIKALTKRTFLSILASIYDPLGWISPFLITGKILLQQLWLEKVDWDELLSPTTLGACSEFVEQLPSAGDLQIPRWVRISPNNLTVELHGFGDASNMAYSAVVYLRVIDSDNTIHVSLICAKTKVAPLKVLTIPRLELCAAALVCRSVLAVSQSLGLESTPVFCWSDSQTVLHWLKTPPHALKCFVANRVSLIQTKLPNAQWCYVPSKENPADCASRGILLSHLRDHSLWWEGPTWLSHSAADWPRQTLDNCAEASRELKPVKVLVAHTTTEELECFSRISKWNTLLRVFSYVNRFIEHCRCGETRRSRPTKILTASEMNTAEDLLLRYVQQRQYAKEIAALKAARPLPVKSPLLSLTPFLNEKAILCVGGRLSNASVSETQKFPAIVPKGKLAELLIRHYHLVTAHGGTQVTLRILREYYWVVCARSITKQMIFRCVICTRHRGRLAQQLMGQLPSVRLNFARPFAHVGVEYAGPLLFRLGSGRGRKAHKCYIALFVCLSVRAIHLELVTDYTTPAFLAAFSRFTARRGLPQTVYSDNGTNFVGADRELSRHFCTLMRDELLHNRMACDRITWKFIPPNAPHFGGIWEAGVKSVKHHLRRVLGQLTPTYEELQTLLCGIEAILNSRPLTPASDDPTDCDALTPGHFLVGSVLKVPPAPSLLDMNANLLSRWQVMRLTLERYWRLCSADYLNALQAKTKWRKYCENLQIGDIVLIQDRNAPPAKWLLGRITQVKPGKDKMVRVVVVRTATSELVRPITQLCKLPVTT